MTLEILFAKAGVDQYKQGLWFRQCAFDGKNLICADDDDVAAYIQKHYMPRFRHVLPTIQFTRVSTVPATPKTTKPSAFKKGYVPDPLKFW